ncbi:MAG: hypothetical protein Kow00124_12330 [Anaerolineae bacterium]
MQTVVRETGRPRAALQGERALFFVIALILLLVSAFFRLWGLGTTPPGLLAEELSNAQIADRVRDGDLAVIYDDVSPAREGLYYGLLAASTALTGRGVILWRLPSVWLAMLSLAMTAQLMRRLFDWHVALLAMGLMGVSFWPVWMGRAVLHVTLVPLVTVVLAYIMLRAFQAAEVTEGSLWFTLGGLVLGVAQYAHVTSWTMIALFLAFVIYRFLVDREGVRPHRGDIVYLFGLVAVLTLPLLIFILRNPGVREPVPLADQPGLVAEMPGRILSAVAGLALRGDPLPEHNLPGRPVLDPLSGLLMLIGIGVCLARWRRPQYGLVLLWLITGLIPTAFLPRQPSFEYMAIILPVVFVLPALGLKAIFSTLRRRVAAEHQGWFQAGFGLLVVLIVGWNAGWSFRDYFTRWPALEAVQEAYQAEIGLLAHYLDTSPDPTPVSICSIPPDRSTDPYALSNEELLSYFMHRRDAGIRYFNCHQSLILANGGESQRIIFPRSHYYEDLPGPLLAWMRYAEDEPVPGIERGVVMRLDVARELADKAGAMMTDAPTAWPPEIGEFRLADLPVTFGYNLAFLGYEVRDAVLRPGDYIELTTYWRLDGPPPPELTQFAHMLGGPFVVLAQADSLGVQINQLKVRDVFLQYTIIPVPREVRSGEYSLSVGMYFPSTGARLPAFENGQYRADRLYMQSVTIER